MIVTVESPRFHQLAKIRVIRGSGRVKLELEDSARTNSQYEDPRMTPQQIELVQTTWAKVAPSADQVAPLFYDRLFEIAPEVKPLFKGDMTEQGKKLMTMLAVAVNGLPHLERIVPAVQEMGVRHSGYGVESEHYEPVGAALLWTLEQGLGEDYTPEVAAAWTETYTTLATVMKDAAAAA